MQKKAPRPYTIGLTPALSPLRPHCFAKDRIQLWKPANERKITDEDGKIISFPTLDLTRIEEVMVNAWKPTTLATYGTGLLLYIIWCDMKGISELDRAPVNAVVAGAFIATIVGSYSGSAVANFLYGLRAWHLVHGLTWKINKLEMDGLLKAAITLAPETSKRKKRRPYTIDFINKILEQLDPDDPFDAATRSCLLTTFYSAARVGETTVPTLNAFNPRLHVKPTNVRDIVTREGRQMTEITLPTTKSAPQGETIQYAK